MLVDLRAVEGGVQNFNDIGVTALSENIDFCEKALETFFLVENVLDSHNLNGHVLV